MTAVSLQPPRFELPRRPITVGAPPREARSPGTQAARVPRASSAPLHITRRGRLALGALLSLLLLAVVLVLSDVIMRSHPGFWGVVPPAATQEVTVLPGDTLWSIASSTGTEGDLRDRIAEIRQLNELDSSGVMAGQHLLVPVP